MLRACVEIVCRKSVLREGVLRGCVKRVCYEGVVRDGLNWMQKESVCRTLSKQTTRLIRKYGVSDNNRYYKSSAYAT